MVVVFLLCDYTQRVFSSASLFSFFFVFKIFIHFDFIFHSFLFLIFLARPLYSRPQLPAMPTQPALRGSELLKPPPPSPLWRSGPQREGWGRWRDQEMTEWRDRICKSKSGKYIIRGMCLCRQCFCSWRCVFTEIKQRWGNHFNMLPERNYLVMDQI